MSAGEDFLSIDPEEIQQVLDEIDPEEMQRVLDETVNTVRQEDLQALLADLDKEPPLEWE